MQLSKKEINAFAEQHKTLYVVDRELGEVLDVVFTGDLGECEDLISLYGAEMYLTREEAEHRLKYTQTRIEQISIPTLNELQLEKEFVFYDKEHGAHSLMIENKMIHIWDKEGKMEYEAKLTKQNYKKACDYCLEVFDKSL